MLCHTALVGSTITCMHLYLCLTVTLANAWFLVKERMVDAFRVTMSELSIMLFALFVTLWPLPMNYPVVDFDYSLYVWIPLGSLLTIAGWICHEGVLEIKAGAAKKDKAAKRILDVAGKENFE